MYVQAFDKILKEYQAEVVRLRRENGAIRAKTSVIERDFANLMTENDNLTEKLEHLEDVFVHGTHHNAGLAEEWQTAVRC